MQSTVKYQTNDKLSKVNFLTRCDFLDDFVLCWAAEDFKT